MRQRDRSLFFSHPDFNRRFWSFTRSTANALLRSRVADFNRRFRFSLTPKNVVLLVHHSRKQRSAARYSLKPGGR